MATRRMLLLAGGTAVGLSAGAWTRPTASADGAPRAVQRPWEDASTQPAGRAAQLAALRRGGFDVLVIGGGATGTGAALDAATRGLRTALVEAEDFAAGTSSRSTKLIHGGVRYLEKAVLQLDYGQLKLVFDALHERLHMLRAAPHLTNPIPTIMPCYKLWEVPYFWAGLKAYDVVAGSSALTWSHFVSASVSRELFPTLLAERPDGQTLKGTIVYYDGQMDDARINVALATTAAMAGAAVLNHVQVVSLTKDENGKVNGAQCRDAFTGEQFGVSARVVINAAGPFCDAVRRMSDKAAAPMITASAGVHVTLPQYFCAEAHGLIVPKTKDGRVVFLLPWLGAAIAGTTDAPTTLSMEPRATAAEVDFILDALQDYVAVKPRRQDVLSAWSGIRPLAADPSKGSTENITRDHVLAAEAGLVTITGGKWTTYRKMAEDAVDMAVSVGKLQPSGGCVTVGMPLTGAAGWHPTLPAELAQAATDLLPPGAVDASTAKHLAQAYGDRARGVLQLAQGSNLAARLVVGHPLLEAEVVYAARHEFCATACDFLARRSRLAFLDVAGARQAIPRVVQLLGDELRWSRARRRSEAVQAAAFLDTFQLPA